MLALALSLHRAPHTEHMQQRHPGRTVRQRRVASEALRRQRQAGEAADPTVQRLGDVQDAQGEVRRERLASEP